MRYNAMKGIYEDLTGWHQPNGRWKVLGRGPDGITKGGNKYVQWWCQCDCNGENSEKLLRTRTITSEQSKSCGCWNSEVHKDIMKQNKKYDQLTEEQVKEYVLKNSQCDFFGAEYKLIGKRWRWVIDISCENCGKRIVKNYDSFKCGQHLCKKCGKSKAVNSLSKRCAEANNLLKQYPSVADIWDYDLNEFGPEHYSSHAKYNAHFYCKKHNYRWQNIINSIVSKSLSRGTNGCLMCSGQVATPETCVAVTHPYIIPYFLNKEDIYNYTAHSNLRTDFICPFCGTIKRNKIIGSMVSNGFSCPSCGDRTSFPERYMYNLLIQMKIEFAIQKTFAWSQNKRYDFYLPQYHLIIETHGSQHYDNHNFSHRGGRTLEEEQENDRIKYNLAINNGYNIICVDCKKSDADYIKNNILSSELIKILNFTNVDWDKVAIDSYTNSIIHQSSILWNEGKTTCEIADMIHRSQKVVTKYLLKANKLNWSEYSGKEDMRRRNIILGQNVKKPVYCIERNQIYDSVTTIEKALNLKHVSSVCLGAYGRPTAGGYHLKYVYDYKTKDGAIIPGAITLGLITEAEALKQLEEQNINPS